MKALVKYASGDGNVEIREVAEPRCGDSEVKLEIAYCGICGTDLHVLHDTFRNYPPVILGHEFSGTVVEVGRNVTNARLGERVTGLGATTGKLHGDSSTNVAATAEDDSKFVLKVGHIVLGPLLVCD